MKKTGLGKGLSALIDENKLTGLSGGFIPNLPIEYITPNPYQPRSEIKPESLVELADSIREHGIIEPLLVTKKSETHFELIAGERRLQAGKLAGLKTVPVVVKEATPQDMLEIAVIENIQREDLNALEEALAFDQLVKEFGLSYEEIAKKVGLSRSAIANKIRLLALPDDIKRGLLEDKISEGHARALLGLKKKDLMIPTYKAILKDHLSVRAVEELVRRLNSGKKLAKKKTIEVHDSYTTQLEMKLKDKFGPRVSLSKSIRGGKIVIPFKSDEELKELTNKLL
ncbi:MAG: chromosome partitioning protein ParB [Candidatus Dojkabacteria bacterium]|nr:MAG: chromosome partitioning protein ParB [Candidatus Dojkabacteria bacterium]